MPPEPFVVADSSALIGLAKAGVFEGLRAQFGTLTITRLVKDEVTARPELPGAGELVAAMREGWIRVAPTPLSTWEHPELDAGEASTLALALEREGALVLMDDIAGRERALQLGLPVRGLAELTAQFSGGQGRRLATPRGAATPRRS